MATRFADGDGALVPASAGAGSDEASSGSIDARLPQNGSAEVTTVATMPQPMLSLRAISKKFPGVVANDTVNLDIYGGEVHAVLGENGAGKSTLMKITYGFYRPDSGQVRLNGELVEIRTPHDARRLRIGMVFQNFTLIPAFSVAENIALFLRDQPALLDRAKIARQIDDMSKRYGLSIDPSKLAGRLSIGEQQKVEVLKLLMAEAQVLVFDEPTSVLPPHEIDGLFQVFDRLRADGFAVIFITHKLREVLRCANRITVMRRGTVSGTLMVSEATEEGLLSLMFGTAPPEHRRKTQPKMDLPPLLELKQVETREGGETARLKEIDLRIHPGEIVGVAGLPGNGQRELGDVILGIERCHRGQKILFGKDATRWSVGEVRARGVAFVPENPIYMAVVPSMTLTENMALAATAKYSRHWGLGMNWSGVRSKLEASLQSLGIRIPPLTTLVGTLSGGNLQRFTLARELAGDPRLIIALHPTRGLDVATASNARDLLIAARDRGAGVLLISQDLDELFSLSDRLMVLRGGTIVGSFFPREVTAYDVGRLMTGAG